MRVQLLEIADVTPAHLAADQNLRIVGDGFPEGRAAEVSLEGTLHREDGAERDVRLDYTAQVDEEAVEIPASALHAHLGTGAFLGAIEVAFADATGRGKVVGRKENVSIEMDAQQTVEGAPARARTARIRGQGDSPDLPSLLAVFVAVVCGLLFLGTLAPTARGVVWVELRATAWIQALSLRAWGKWAASRSSMRRDRMSVAVILTFGLAAASVVGSAPLSIHLGLVTLTTAAAGTALYASRALRNGAENTRWKDFALDNGVALVALVPAFVHAGTLDAAACTAGQGAAPWAWAIAEHPSVLLAFLAFVEGGIVGRSARAPGAFTLVHRLVLGCVGSIVFLGGTGGSPLLGPLLVVLKTALLTGIGMGAAPIERRFVAPVLASLSVIAVLVVPAGGIYASWGPPITTAILGGLLIAGVLRSVRSTEAPAVFATHPLL